MANRRDWARCGASAVGRGGLISPLITSSKVIGDLLHRLVSEDLGVGVCLLDGLGIVLHPGVSVV